MVSTAIKVTIGKAYIAPLSVVGGANRSGFSSSMGTFSGPIIVPPSEGAPVTGRIGWGTISDSGPHSASLGSSLAYGTVGVLGCAEEVADDAGAAAVKGSKKRPRDRARLTYISKRSSETAP